MLKNTFHHISGIGAKTEERLWESGSLSWDSFSKDTAGNMSKNKFDKITGYLQESEMHLREGNPRFFFDLLPPNLHWRIFPEFRDSVAYLDIETTGLDRYFEKITTIVLYDGKSISHYVNGQNLDAFKEDIQKYKVLVTYNGRCFDVPFIEKYFGITLNHAHIDLRYVLSSLGYKGGLKGCERQLGFDRGDLSDVDGFFAVLLWNEYQKKHNEIALETLLAYNTQDAVTLEALMVIAYNLKIKETPFYERNRISDPVSPENPFKVDVATIKKIENSSDYLYRGGWY